MMPSVELAKIATQLGGLAVVSVLLICLVWLIIKSLINSAGKFLQTSLEIQTDQIKAQNKVAAAQEKQAEAMQRQAESMSSLNQTVQETLTRDRSDHDRMLVDIHVVIREVRQLGRMIENHIEHSASTKQDETPNDKIVRM